MLTLFQKHFSCNNINDLYVKNSILKISDIYKLKVGIFMHQMIHGSCHSKLFHAITHDDLLSPRDTRDSTNLSIRSVFPRVNAVKYSFQYQFSRVWNNIPVEIKQIENLKQFKKAYSSLLLGFYAVTEC